MTQSWGDPRCMTVVHETAVRYEKLPGGYVRGTSGIILMVADELKRG